MVLTNLESRSNLLERDFQVSKKFGSKANVERFEDGIENDRQ